jgi:hypothetical protein
MHIVLRKWKKVATMLSSNPTEHFKEKIVSKFIIQNHFLGLKVSHGLKLANTQET